MPIKLNGTSPDIDLANNPWGDAAITRSWTLTDKDGVVHKIETPRDLENIIAQMTPQEFEDWKARVRFSPILNNTGILDYTGTLRDI